MKKDIASILSSLVEMHGEPRVELSYSSPLELTIATVLSARCTDERVNVVTKDLFEKYKKLEDYLDVPDDELEGDIRTTGFYRNKARSIKNIARELLERFGGKVPDDIDTLATVSGIGRKSANMIVGLAYGKPGIIVDTHVARVAGRLGLTASKDPDKIEIDLKRELPEPIWMAFSLLTILHGRYICRAKKPECRACLLREVCDYAMGG